MDNGTAIKNTLKKKNFCQYKDFFEEYDIRGLPIIHICPILNSFFGDVFLLHTFGLRQVKVVFEFLILLTIHTQARAKSFM